MCSFASPAWLLPGEADEVADGEGGCSEAESWSLQAVTAPAVKASRARADRARCADRRSGVVRDMTDPLDYGCCGDCDIHHSVNRLIAESGWHACRWCS
ncbi:hypothetical protein SHIRM173S_04431 [Streptomyces hirsutus]